MDNDMDFNKLVISLLEKQNIVNNNNQTFFKNILEVLSDLTNQIDKLEKRVSSLELYFARFNNESGL
jgi:hypothetical protein